MPVGVSKARRVHYGGVTCLYPWLALSAFLVTCSVSRYKRWVARCPPTGQGLLLACPSKTCPALTVDGSIMLSLVSAFASNPYQ